MLFFICVLCSSVFFFFFFFNDTATTEIYTLSLHDALPTFAQDGVGRPRGGYEYARTQNPTRERLERAVADLEGGRHGIAFASGSATTAAIAQLAASGQEILVGDDVYGGTFRYFERVHRPAGAAEARYLDLS